MTINDTTAALDAFDVTDDTLSPEQLASFDRDGFLVLPPDPDYWSRAGVALDDFCAELDRLVETEGWRGGSEGKEDIVSPTKQLDPGSNRLGNLIDKHSIFRKCIAHPKVLAAVRHVIGDDFKCSAADMRMPRKGHGRQHLHIDWVPRISQEEPHDCVFAGLFLDDMNCDNGAIRVVPGTHTNLDWPDEHIDPFATHPDEIQVELPAGSIVVMNAHTWHGGATNHSGAMRRTIYVDYRNRRLGQLLNQKQYLRPETIATLSPAERYLLAVRDVDPTDEAPSLGPGDSYRARYADRKRA